MIGKINHIINEIVTTVFRFRKFERNKIKQLIGILKSAKILWVALQFPSSFLVEKILIPINGLYGMREHKLPIKITTLHKRNKDSFVSITVLELTTLKTIITANASVNNQCKLFLTLLLKNTKTWIVINKV